MSEQDQRFISRVLIDGDIMTPVRTGVTREMIQSAEYRDVFDHILRHHAKYNQVPSGLAVKQEFPGIAIKNVHDSLEYVTDALFAENRRAITQAMVQSMVNTLERRGSPEDLADIARKSLQTFDGLSNVTNEYDLTRNPMDRWQDYLQLKTAPGGLLGPATGFPTIDEATAGLQAGQLVTIIASPKTGKSQLALRVATNVHNAGGVVMFQTFEMSNEEQIKRYDAMKSEISHNRLRRGSLVAKEERKYEAMLKALAGQKAFILSDSSVGITVSAVAAKAQQHKPELLVIDGVYLMIDEISGEVNSPTALTNITRSLKRLAQRLQIPILISTQTLTWKMKKHKLDANSIGYSSSFFQDSDVILGLERTEDDDETMRLLRIVASRNCGPAETVLIWDWDAGRFEEPSASSAPTTSGRNYTP